MKTIVKRLALMLCCAGLFLASCSDDEASDAQRTLMEVIREAETLVAEVEEGTSEGDIAPGSKKILQAWIDQAYFIMNNTSREEVTPMRRNGSKRPSRPSTRISSNRVSRISLWGRR